MFSIQICERSLFIQYFLLLKLPIILALRWCWGLNLSVSLDLFLRVRQSDRARAMERAVFLIALFPSSHKELLRVFGTPPACPVAKAGFASYRLTLCWCSLSITNKQPLLTIIDGNIEPLVLLDCFIYQWNIPKFQEKKHFFLFFRWWEIAMDINAKNCLFLLLHPYFFLMLSRR